MNVKATTKIYGIFGSPVEHSLSPAMHNSAFSHLGLNCVYVAFNVKPQNISDAANSIKTLGISGINVTIPHKESIMEYLDELSESASLTGAVNTIVNRDGKLLGFNTDVQGLMRALKEELSFEPEGKNAFLVGAGGASRAAISGLCLGGIKKIVIANRTHSKAETLAEEFSKHFGEVLLETISLSDVVEIKKEIPDIDLVINSSSAGMSDQNPLSLPLDDANANCVIYDLVYKPLETSLVKQARKIGLSAQSGLGMLLYQGVESFEIWTGREAPVEVMRKAINQDI